MPCFYDEGNGQWGQGSMYKLKANCSGSCLEKKNEAGLCYQGFLLWLAVTTEGTHVPGPLVALPVPPCPAEPPASVGSGLWEVLRSRLGQTTVG